MQTTPPFGDGSSIVAATRDGLTTGFGFKYFRRFHIATSSWNVFAQLGFNPYSQSAVMDLSITKTDGQSEVTPGATVTYTLTVASSGPGDAVGALITDVFPLELNRVSWTCDATGGGTCENASGSGDIRETVSLPAGASLTFTATAVVDEEAVGTLTNTAKVEAPEGAWDPTQANDTATDVDVIRTPHVFSDGFESGDTSAWSLAVP